MEEKINEIATKHVDGWCNDSTGTKSLYEVVTDAINDFLHMQRTMPCAPISNEHN